MSLHAAHPLQPTPPARARWFPGHPESLSEVRRFIAEELPDHPRQDDAILLTSELATNAVEHTRSGQQDGGFLVVVERTYTEVVRITVHDSGSRQETPTWPNPELTTNTAEGSSSLTLSPTAGEAATDGTAEKPGSRSE
ncbi:ATP-binding protein [Thermobifida cellulosilytica]|uniref:ATP-binding protein n=1 Tax=Thermobifida cellulosilytica TaxID=144786 RepID=UPI000A852F76|nr:ATP-binding protein [Thermobifida cellulosilytica]